MEIRGCFLDILIDLNILKDLNSKGKTVVMITHNQDHAQMFEKVIELVDGKVVSDEK